MRNNGEMKQLIYCNEFITFVCVCTLVYFMCFFMCEFWKSSFKIHKKIVSVEFDIGSFNISRQIALHICVSCNGFDNNQHHFSHNIDHLDSRFFSLKCIQLHTKSISLFNSCFAPFVYFKWLSIYKILLVLILNLVFSLKCGIWEVQVELFFYIYITTSIRASEQVSIISEKNLKHSNASEII